MKLFFVIDEYTDVMDENAVRKLGFSVMDALHNPYDCERTNGSVVGEIARQ